MTEPSDPTDVRWMRRALRVGERGDPSPEPHAGALVARGEELIGVGHQRRGAGPRAELDALARAGARARGATLYVTLEPSGTHDAILAAGVKRVVVGCRQPAASARVSARRLRAAGVELVLGVEQAAAERLIADFAKHTLHGLPHVTLKAAITLDGHTAARSGESKWITGPAARRHTHRLRAYADAVLVGVGTVLADDPELTVRMVRGRDPLRVVLDSQLRTPLRAKLVASAREVRTLIFHAPGASPTRARKLAAAGVELASVRAGGTGLHLPSVLRALAQRDVVRVLVEGGSRVHGALLEAGLADAAAIFVAPRILGDVRGLPLAHVDRSVRLQDAWALEAPRIRQLGDDVLWHGPLRRPAR